MKKIISSGPPGAGKGTQADLICEVLEIPKISTGDMLRAAIASQSPFGKKVENILVSGALVSDDVIIELINDRLLPMIVLLDIYLMECQGLLDKQNFLIKVI